MKLVLWAIETKSAATKKWQVPENEPVFSQESQAHGYVNILVSVLDADPKKVRAQEYVALPREDFDNLMREYRSAKKAADAALEYYGESSQYDGDEEVIAALRAWVPYAQETKIV